MKDFTGHRHPSPRDWRSLVVRYCSTPWPASTCTWCTIVIQTCERHGCHSPGAFAPDTGARSNICSFACYTRCDRSMSRCNVLVVHLGFLSSGNEETRMFMSLRFLDHTDPNCPRKHVTPFEPFSGILQNPPAQDPLRQTQQEHSPQHN